MPCEVGCALQQRELQCLMVVTQLDGVNTGLLGILHEPLEPLEHLRHMASLCLKSILINPKLMLSAELESLLWWALL